jgi:hypothetical protein
MRRSAIASSSAALLLASLLVSAPPASADYQPWGSTSAEKQRLRNGCRYYAYTYRVHPPVDDWAAEVFLVGPKGGQIASAVFDRFLRPLRRPGTLADLPDVRGRRQVQDEDEGDLSRRLRQARGLGRAVVLPPDSPPLT